MASSESAGPGSKVDLGEPRFNTSTYAGRLAHFYSSTSPLTLLASKSQLLEATAAVRGRERQLQLAGGKPVWVDRAQRDLYWRQRQLVESSIHPDSGDVVPLPFRFSAFVPMNLVVCAGMLTPNPSLRTLIFWQWANQSLNVGTNFANANKSIAMSNQEVGVAYAAATLTSLGIAISLTRLVPRIPNSVLSEAKRTLAMKFVPFLSVAGAGVVNISCIRWKEIRDGITVFRIRSTPSEDPKGRPTEVREDLGTSPTAGARAVAQSAGSRVLCNIPTLILPPILMTFLSNRTKLFAGPRGKVVENLSHLSIIGLSLFVFLPPSIAVFPQRAAIRIGQLEPEVFDSKVDPARGGKDEVVFFNKGL